MDRKKDEDKVYTGVPKEKTVMSPIQRALNDLAKKDTNVSINVPTPDGRTAPGLMIAKRFAQGGMVPEPIDMSSIPPPVPPMPVESSVPPLGDLTSSLNSTPNTNYDFFKDLSANDRATLQQKLLSQQNSAPNMVAQGFAGLGDAISNSFGGKNTSFQKDTMANNELQQKKQLDAFDTQRTQKMQDMNANMEMQQNDPRSPLSMSMQKTFRSAGVNVPSGMPASMMMKIAPALGELAMKQATLELQKSSTMAQQEIARQGQKNQATEALAKMGPISRLFHGEEADQLKKAAGINGPAHGIPDLGQTFNGGKVVKVTRIK